MCDTPYADSIRKILTSSWWRVRVVATTAVHSRYVHRLQSSLQGSTVLFTHFTLIQTSVSHRLEPAENIGSRFQGVREDSLVLLLYSATDMSPRFMGTARTEAHPEYRVQAPFVHPEKRVGRVVCSSRLCISFPIASTSWASHSLLFLSLISGTATLHLPSLPSRLTLSFGLSLMRLALCQKTKNTLRTRGGTRGSVLLSAGPPGFWFLVGRVLFCTTIRR